VATPFGQLQRQINNSVLPEELHLGATSLAHLQALENRRSRIGSSNYTLEANSRMAEVSYNPGLSASNAGVSASKWKSGYLQC